MTNVIEVITDIDGISYELYENSFNPDRPKIRRFGIRTFVDGDDNCTNTFQFATLEEAEKSFEETRKYTEEELND